MVARLRQDWQNISRGLRVSFKKKKKVSQTVTSVLVVAVEECAMDMIWKCFDWRMVFDHQWSVSDDHRPAVDSGNCRFLRCKDHQQLFAKWHNASWSIWPFLAGFSTLLCWPFSHTVSLSLYRALCLCTSTLSRVSREAALDRSFSPSVVLSCIIAQLIPTTISLQLVLSISIHLLALPPLSISTVE